jgi:FixJ family two-component response regulator
MGRHVTVRPPLSVLRSRRSTHKIFLHAVAEARSSAAPRSSGSGARSGASARYEALIAREREVLGPVVAGLLNKLIADRFGIAETTIKAHRGRLMEKMRAASLADLLRMSERLGLAPDADPPQR